jgi:hypothetical protein
MFGDGCKLLAQTVMAMGWFNAIKRDLHSKAPNKLEYTNMP